MSRTAWLGGDHIGDAVRLRFRDNLVAAQSVVRVMGRRCECGQAEQIATADSAEPWLRSEKQTPTFQTHAVASMDHENGDI